MGTVFGGNYLKLLLESIVVFSCSRCNAEEKMIQIMGLYDVEIMAIDTTHSG